MWFDRFDRRYREWLTAGLRAVDLKGLATSGFHNPRLDEVFVDLSLVPRPVHEVPGDVLGTSPARAARRWAIGDLLGRSEPAVLAVVGAPGSGKTTLLRHTAQRLARGRGARRVPVLLYLRDHVAAIVESPDVALSALAGEEVARNGPPGGVPWFERRLADGACVVLLDGLDEVADQEHRVRVSRWVERQVQRYSRNDFVLTSRPGGYESAPLAGATAFQVRHFTEEQVSRFVHGWYRVVERHRAQEGEDTAAAAARAANALLELLAHNPSLHDLTVNPLLLTMLVNVHLFRGALPAGRADLYQEICQALLWRRQEAKRLPSALTGDRKVALVRRLAYWMMVKRVRDVPREAALSRFEPALRRMTDEVGAADFLAEVVSSGLLVERENGQYAFAHQTFQEYLASAHLREKGLGGSLTASVDDLWWRETTLLYVARSDGDAVVRACLASQSVRALDLALHCAEESNELAPELKAELAGLATAAVDPAVPEDRRRHLGAVLVSRHLSQVVRAPSGGLVCVKPITPELYSLYRNHKGHGERRWYGIWQEDALGFAEWASAITGIAHRLPSEEEVGIPVVVRALERRMVHFSGEQSYRWDEMTEPSLTSKDLMTAHLLLAEAKRLRDIIVVLHPQNAVRDRPYVADIEAVNLFSRIRSQAAVEVSDRAWPLASDFVARLPGDAARALVDVLGKALADLTDLRTDLFGWLGQFGTETPLPDFPNLWSPERAAATVAALPTYRKSWAGVCVRWLQATAVPLLRGETEPTAAVAAEVRLALHCLRREVDPKTSERLVAVARVVRFVEGRASGRLPMNEAIVLARDE
ncbi:NACHT domain-containing protein [Actinosynnema sp. NPDC020468]|uniref:NACHT domain-containing protein n=1 Tax=Actinosynnema sp. NPDC020468 TaxID=3154488 RepID=UPI00340FA796